MKTSSAHPRSTKRRNRLAELYKRDDVAWLQESMALIRQKRYDKLDYDHLFELLEIELSGEKREMKSRLISLMAHLLKWQFQPKKRTGSWKRTIRNQREQLEMIFESATMRSEATLALPKAYERAVGKASDETKLPPSTFPVECPYSFNFLVSDQFPEADDPE